MPEDLYQEDELLMLSGIQHFAFCKRQWALIHIEQQWEENARTAEGHILHERVHNPMLTEKRGDVIIARSVPLVSKYLGLYGMADLVEFWKVRDEAKGIHLSHRSGLWMPKPVEYKRGKPKPDERDEVQLCAQAICMEEMMNVFIEEGELYYGEFRRRYEVILDTPLRNKVIELSHSMHEMFKSRKTPDAEKGKHCSLCSMKEICIPSLTRTSRSVANYIRKQVGELDEMELMLNQ